MKRSEVLEIVAALRDRFPKASKEFSSRHAAAFCEDLVDLDFGISLAVVRKIAASSPFFPSIAEFREAYADLAAPTMDADEAWAAAKRHGHAIAWGRHKTSTATDIHPAIEDAVRGLGGWRELGQSTDKMADRAHFIKLYAISRKRHRDKVIVQPLIEDTQRKLLGGKIAEKEEKSGDAKDSSEESQNVRRLGRR